MGGEGGVGGGADRQTDRDRQKQRDRENERGWIDKNIETDRHTAQKRLYFP